MDNPPPRQVKCCGDEQRGWYQTDSGMFVNLFKPQFLIYRAETTRNSIYPRE